MTENREQLLRSLAINRQDSGPAVARGSYRGAVMSVMAVAAVLLGLWLALPQFWTGGHAEQRAVAEAKAEPAAPPKTPASPTKPVQAGGLTASGYVVARRKAAVAAEITGKVLELFVDEEVVVKQGQVVAQLDSALAEADLSLAKSRAIAAEAAATAIAADLRDAERILGRVQTLSQRSYASEADLTKAETKAGVLRAQLGQAEANAQTARLDVQRSATMLDKHKIRAPFGGVVVERSAQPGEMISPMSAGGSFTRTGICTIVDMDSIEVEVDVNEAFIGRVQPGGAIQAVLDAYPDWSIPAAVMAVVPTANREKATVKVRIALKQKDPRILPDMAVKVKFLDHEVSADERVGRRPTEGKSSFPTENAVDVREPARSSGWPRKGVRQRQGHDLDLRSSRPVDPKRRLRRGHGTIRLGQDHAAQSARRHRPAGRRRNPRRRRAHRRHERRRARPLARRATSASSSSSTT